MGSKIKIVIVLCAAAFLVTVLLIFLIEAPEYINTSFAERVIVEFTNGASPFSTEVEIGDVIELRNIFHGKQAVRDSPSCPIGSVRITFISDDKELSLYPAGDDCPTVATGGIGCFMLSENENKRVREILVKYGIVYPFI